MTDPVLMLQQQLQHSHQINENCKNNDLLSSKKKSQCENSHENHREVPTIGAASNLPELVDHDDNESGFYDVPWEHQQQQLLLQLQQHQTQPAIKTTEHSFAAAKFCSERSPSIPQKPVLLTPEKPSTISVVKSSAASSSSASFPGVGLKSPSRGSVPTKALLPPVSEPITFVDLASIRSSKTGVGTGPIGMGNMAAGAAARFRSHQATKRNQVTLNENSSMVNGAVCVPTTATSDCNSAAVVPSADAVLASSRESDQLFVTTKNTSSSMLTSSYVNNPHSSADLSDIVASSNDILNGSTDSGTGSDLKVSPIPPSFGCSHTRCSSISPSLTGFPQGPHVDGIALRRRDRNSNSATILQACTASQQSLAITSATKNVFLRELQKRPPCGVRAKNLVKDRRKEGQGSDSQGAGSLDQSSLNNLGSRQSGGDDDRAINASPEVCGCCDVASTSTNPISVCSTRCTKGACVLGGSEIGNSIDCCPVSDSRKRNIVLYSDDDGFDSSGVVVEHNGPDIGKPTPSYRCCDASSDNKWFVFGRPPIYASSHAILPTMQDAGGQSLDVNKGVMSRRHRLASSHDDLSRLTATGVIFNGVNSREASDGDQDTGDVGVIWERRSGHPPLPNWGGSRRKPKDTRPASEYDVPWDVIDLAVALRQQQQICRGRMVHSPHTDSPAILRTRAISGDRGFASGGDSLSSSGDDATLDSSYHGGSKNAFLGFRSGSKSNRTVSGSVPENGIDCNISYQCSTGSKSHKPHQHIISAGESARYNSALGKRTNSFSLKNWARGAKNGVPSSTPTADRSVLFSPHPHRAAIVIPTQPKATDCRSTGCLVNEVLPSAQNQDGSFCSCTTKPSTAANDLCCSSPHLMSVHDTHQLRPFVPVAVSSTSSVVRVQLQTSNFAGYKRDQLRDSRKKNSAVMSKKDNPAVVLPSCPDVNCATPVMETAFCIRPKPGQRNARCSPVSIDEERERLIQELCHRQDLSSRCTGQSSPLDKINCLPDDLTSADPSNAANDAAKSGQSPGEHRDDAVRLRKKPWTPETPVPATPRKPLQRQALSSPINAIISDSSNDCNGGVCDVSLSKFPPVSSSSQISAKTCLASAPNPRSSQFANQPFTTGATHGVDGLPSLGLGLETGVCSAVGGGQHERDHSGVPAECSDRNFYDFPPSSYRSSSEAELNAHYDNCRRSDENGNLKNFQEYQNRQLQHSNCLNPHPSLNPGARCSLSSHPGPQQLPITDVLASMTNGITPPPTSNLPYSLAAQPSKLSSTNHELLTGASISPSGQSPRSWFGKRFKTNSAVLSNLGVTCSGKPASSSENRLSPDSIGPPMRLLPLVTSNQSPLCAENLLMDCRSPVRHIDSTLSDSSLGVCGFVGGLNKGLTDADVNVDYSSRQVHANHVLTEMHWTGEQNCGNKWLTSYRKLSASHNSLTSIYANGHENSSPARDRSLDRFQKVKVPPLEDLDYDVPWEFCNPNKVNRLIAGDLVEERKPLKSMQKFSPKSRNAKFSKLDRGNLSLNFGCAGLNPVAEKIDPNVALETQCWYHGAISRAEAEQRLRNSKEGSYLVRVCESNSKEYALSLKSAKGFMHMKMQRNEEGRWILGYFSQPFSSIPRMIRYYSLNKLPIKGAEHMCLLYPVQDQLL